MHNLLLILLSLLCRVKHDITPEQLQFVFMPRLKESNVPITSTDALRLLTTALGHGCKQLSYRDVARLFKRTIYQCSQTLSTW